MSEGVEALYLHVPFCVRRCRYCDFATAATHHDDARMLAYERSLERLVGQAREIGLLGRPRSAYVGGGTPTMLGAEGLPSLVSAICAAGPVDELSFEANPESLSDELLARAREAGATRVSVGVQSFDDRELRGLGRVHDALLARDRVAAAVDSGLDVSLDLMCGIPFQTPESWRSSLVQAVELGVGHVSCYPLMIEPGTPLERMCESGQLPWPSDDTEADDMEAALEVLGQAGFSRYEVASYARPGKRCAHNVRYWTGVEYLGLGAAAASMLSRASYLRLREAAPALAAPIDDAVRFRLTICSTTDELVCATSLASLSFEVEQLSEREAVAEDLMLAARMTDGLPTPLIEHARTTLGSARVDDALANLVRLGLLERGSVGSLVPTHDGWLLGNELYGALWDLAGDPSQG